MQKIMHLERPAKVFILVIVLITFLLLGAIAYLEITNNNVIEAMSRYFTGDTESEIVLEEAISFEKEEKKDDNLDAGVTEVRQKGEEGKKKLVFRVTKDSDGNEINRTLIMEEIVAEPVKEIVAVGTKVPVQPTPAPSNTPSNNGGSRPSQPQSNNGSSGNTNQGGVKVIYCAGVITSDGHYFRESFFKTVQQSCKGLGAMEISSGEYYSHPLSSNQTLIGIKPGVVLEVREETNCGALGEVEAPQRPCIPEVYHIRYWD